MTREERTYFYNQLYKLFHDWVEENKGDDLYLKSIALNSFANRYMQTITGQQPLPQTVFRAFLDECMPTFENVQMKYDKALNTGSKFVVGAINELRDAIGASGGGDKEVIEVENEDALDQIEEPSKEVIYITADTGQLYIYDGEKFINVTNKQVGNTLYVPNIEYLIGREYENGLYVVIIIGALHSKTYNLNVYGMRHTLRLYNHNGWAEVATNEDGEKYWKWHRYTYEGHTHTTQDVIGLAEVIEEVTSKKQDKVDNNLETSNKTVVGAINEVLGRVDAAYHSFTVDFQESREVVQMRTVAGAINIERIMADNIATLKLHVNGNAQTISLRDGVWNGLITIPSDALFVWNVGRITEGEIASISVKYNF